MIDHFGFPVADLDRSVAFYLGVFAPLGLHETTRFSHPGGTVVGLAYTDGSPFLWLTTSHTDPDGVGPELHLALAAADVAGVDAVHAAAQERDVEILHPPRSWPEYHPGYYAVFLRDPDGHNVEAVTHAGPID